MIAKYMFERLVLTLIYRTIYVARDLVGGPQYTTQAVHIPHSCWFHCIDKNISGGCNILHAHG